MKILINRKPVEGPWGGGNLFVRAFCGFLSGKDHTVVHEFSDDVDAIFMQDPRYSDLGISVNEILAYKRWKPSTRVIHRVNECDARKNTADIDDLLRQCSEHTDTTVFVSEWMRQYHLTRGWKCQDTHVIHNGVDKEHFRPTPTEDKINNGKINIVTHHWSSNRMKGFDVYEALDSFVGEHPGFTFSYVGRDLGTFQNALVIPPLHGLQLGRMLSRYDVYVSGSLFDPGPNHVLEALACEIPTYVIKSGGGAVEFAGENHSYETMSELIDILSTKNFAKNQFVPHSWNSCVMKYKACLERN